MRSYLEEQELKRTEKKSKALAAKSKIEEQKGDSNEEDEVNAWDLYDEYVGPATLDEQIVAKLMLMWQHYTHLFF